MSSDPVVSGPDSPGDVGPHSSGGTGSDSSNSPPPAGDAPVAFAFFTVLFSNLLPIVGVVALDWRFGEVLFLYWAEFWVVLLGYAGAALFAQRPLRVEGRHFFLPGVDPDEGRDEERWGGDPRTIQVTNWMPPVYPRNGRLVVAAVVAGAVLLLVPAAEFLSGLESVLTLPVLGTLAAMTSSHLLELQRDYFAQREYERMSAHMVLEIPLRLALFAFGFFAFVVVIGGFLYFAVVVGAQGGVDETSTARVPAELFVVALTFGKLLIELSRFHVEHDDDPSGLTTWFLPENPHEE